MFKEETRNTPEFQLGGCPEGQQSQSDFWKGLPPFSCKFSPLILNTTAITHKYFEQVGNNKTKTPKLSASGNHLIDFRLIGLNSPRVQLSPKGKKRR